MHGHFYQPTRENPFTGALVDHAPAPFRNWNERIAAECYAANLAAPILGADGKPRRHMNNYEWISFDFGPTLLEWLAKYDSVTYHSILDADRRSADRFGGHGSAIAQSYNHTILPLSNSRDQKTQIKWGIRDFAHRYGRDPQGMWLPETAVDMEILQILHEEGIRFTLLSPYQAEAVREDGGEWSDVTGGYIDTRAPYFVALPGGGQISVFFYDGPLSQEIAFNGLLEDGHLLAKRLIAATGETQGLPTLAHVATDGESYGHHHRFGEMALAVALEVIDNDPDLQLTNYGQFLSVRPPTSEVRIIEDSSWSCSHGIERWRSDCGCSSGSNPGWNQAWRTPLREALDWLRDSLVPDFEALAGTVLHEPWHARNEFVEVLLGEPETDFIDRHAVPGASRKDRDRALGHLEIQHRAMLMYTSCGWFFDDVAGLETVLVLRHSGRVIDLTRRVTGSDLEPEFLVRLDRAHSNREGTTARDVYLEEVEPYLAAETPANSGV